MRITFKILFVALLIVMLSLAFTACDTGNGDDVVVCTHQWGEWKAVREPTCNEKGTAQRVCSACGESETSTTEALDHIFDPEKGRFLWSEDHLSADYEYSCLRCGDAEKAIAKVTRTTVPADCEKAEEIIYTATYIENGDTYTDTYSESGPEVGHDYDIDSVEWIWNGNESAHPRLSLSAGFTWIGRAICEEKGREVKVDSGGSVVGASSEPCQALLPISPASASHQLLAATSTSVTPNDTWSYLQGFTLAT